MCGADVYLLVLGVDLPGSPPRVRSRRSMRRSTLLIGRITSACAEQTYAAYADDCREKDHLRVCGADRLTCNPIADIDGSPPRVRSRPFLT